MLINYNLIFFNQYHRGDLFTHKEFIRQVKAELNWANIEQWNFNHPKCVADLGIPLTRAPTGMDPAVKFYRTNLQDNMNIGLIVNTWIGCYGDIFNKYGGVNLLSLTESWKLIFAEINEVMKTKLVVNNNIETYLPTIDYDFFNLDNVERYLMKGDRKRALFCNGEPMSTQSFTGDMSDDIKALAEKRTDIDFICTKKFDTEIENILFTDDIIADTEEWKIKTHWTDMPKNICDVNEISFLSTKCNAIIGKNSGPFVFCETKDNYMDKSKIMLSFSRGPQESMSNSVKMKCDYRLVSDHTPANVSKSINEVIEAL